MIAAADVRARLHIPSVLDALGVPYRRCGDELRTKVCARCGERSTACVCIALATGVWVDHAHGCRGDVFALVAGYAGLDVTRDYPRVVALAAELAGIAGETPDPDRDRRLAERRRADDERRQREQAEQVRLAAEMPSRWEALARRSHRGESYLARRGLDPVALRDRGDVVRFTPVGDPAVPLRDLATGAIVGIQYRRIEGDSKLRCERGSQLAGSALSGRLTDLDPEGADVAVIVEGLADVLAAHLMFQGCAIFGAPGWQQLERIAAVIAPRVRGCRGWILISPDNDEQGIAGATAATVAARDAGLVLDRDLHLVDLGQHHDLADAYAAGWRYSWPKGLTS